MLLVQRKELEMMVLASKYHIPHTVSLQCINRCVSLSSLKQEESKSCLFHQTECSKQQKYEHGMADKKQPSLCLSFSYQPLVLLTCLQEIQDFSSLLWDLDLAQPPSYLGWRHISCFRHFFKGLTQVPKSNKYSLTVLCSNVCLARLIFPPFYV